MWHCEKKMDGKMYFTLPLVACISTASTTGQSYAASAMVTVLCVHIILLLRGSSVALSPMMPHPGHFLPPSTAVCHVPFVITFLTQIVERN